MTRQKAKADATSDTTSLIVHDTPRSRGPWTVEPHTPDRDLWTVRTSEGLVIGPIFGKRNAHMVAGAPTMYSKLDQIAKGTRDSAGVPRTALRRLAEEGRASATAPQDKE